ncbi:PKD domain-containing protein [Litoribacter ruber]|uniref:Ig-like domain-containing protein n=1 Tax=Litoribacter ruber TaxID=702568 RepID=UPI001BD9AC4C|nr:PKD domain-containing protein [Litoribacter ruber]MBT0813061.1 PKD domain-containing protein [Litoribacter ruber]
MSISFSCEEIIPEVTSNSRWCEGQVGLSVSQRSGFIPQWYDPSGNLVSSNWNFNTPSIAETTVYSVRLKHIESECLTAPVDVTATVQQVGEVAVDNVSRCDMGEVTFIGATAQDSDTFLWYDAAGDLKHEGAQFTTSVTAEETLFYVEGRNTAEGCIGPRKEVFAYVETPPGLPQTTDGAICGPGRVSLAAEGGSVYRWYSQQEGGESIAENNGTYLTDTLENSTQFWVSMVSNSDCEGNRASVMAYINDEFTDSITFIGNRRYGNGEVNIQVANPKNNTEYRWYDQGIGGEPVHIGDSYPTDIEIGDSLYVEAELNETCIGERVNVPLHIESDFDFSAYRLSCATAFYSKQVTDVDCFIKSFEWTFGDGAPTVFGPESIHVYGADGTYTVTLKVSYTCGTEDIYISEVTHDISVNSGGFTQDQFRSETRVFKSPQTNRVVNSQVMTYSDNWLLPFQQQNLRNKSAFENGSQGVFRTASNYYYEADRGRSANTNTAQDGLYTVDGFNWQLAEQELIPDWVVQQTVTGYTENSKPAEVRDALGIYSSELYNNNGQMLIAQALNSGRNEIAFSSFESEDYLQGNWQFGEDNYTRFAQIPVILGNGYAVIVNKRMEDISDIETVSGWSTSFNLFTPLAPSPANVWSFNFRFNNANILCMDQHPTNPNYTILVLDQLASRNVWLGSLHHLSFVGLDNVGVIDDNYAHSGNKSLKITDSQEFEQPALDLQQGKSYFLSAWASTKTGNTLREGTEIRVTFIDEEEEEVGETFLYASSSGIDGWVQVKGSFVFPEGASTMALTFYSGNQGDSWWDDIRLHPEEGEIQTYVYDAVTDKLVSTLDQENYGTFYFYDAEGNLRLVKKETFDGMKTIQEAEQYQVER